jgi:hypothetical protein
MAAVMTTQVTANEPSAPTPPPGVGADMRMPDMRPASTTQPAAAAQSTPAATAAGTRRESGRGLRACAAMASAPQATANSSWRRIQVG